jgi:hypothetical protein
VFWKKQLLLVYSNLNSLEYLQSYVLDTNYRSI